MKSWCLGGVFDPDALKKQVSELEETSAEMGFWDDRNRAEAVMSQIKMLKSRYKPWEDVLSGLEEVKTLLDLSIESDEQQMYDEVFVAYSKLNSTCKSLQNIQLLSEETDPLPAFLTIHSGAGGTESCDWVAMLYRMYHRWVERKSFTCTVLAMQEAEGGLKSVDLQIDGAFAHGLLKSEGGIHRLVRISPFDSAKRRHTSFASVYISPVINDDIDVSISNDDIRVDTYRASGAGGQHVNKTSSAVRITHLETGIVVQCQNERSQLKNRSTAMKVLKSRLYEYLRLEADKERSSKAAAKKDISWGSQIRSYVFHPYTLVKDLRTRYETSNISIVMDGEINGFIDSYLKWQLDRNSS